MVFAILFGCTGNPESKKSRAIISKDSPNFKLEVTSVEQVILLKEFEPANTFPYYTNGSWRFVNNDAELVLNDAFEKCGFFKSGYAWVVKNSKYGVINRKGEFIIPCKYDGAARMENGFVPVKQNNLWGFFDTTGTQVISFLYEDYSFSDDGTIHVKQNRQWGMIDYQGKQICLPLYDYDFEFVNGIAIVYRKGKSGVIDKRCNVLLECLHNSVAPINDSLFIVEVSRGYNNEYYGLVKIGNELVIPQIYKKLIHINDGLLIANGETRSGLLNIQGDTIIDFMYSDLQWENTNLLSACGPSKCGYISLKNDTIIPFKYDKANPFNGNFAVIYENGKMGIINSHSELVIPLKEYTSIEKLSKNLILLKWRNNLEGGSYYTFVDTNGQSLIDIEFDELQYHDLPDWTGDINDVMNFGKPQNGYVIVGKKGKVGMIDLKGKMVIPLKYHYLKPMNEYGYTVGTYWNKKAVISNRGEQITDLMFDDILWDEENKYFYAVIKIPEERHERIYYKDVHAGYIGFNGRYYGSWWKDHKKIPDTEEYILKIREEYKRIQKNDKKSEYINRVFGDGLKGSLNLSASKFIVVDPIENIRYEYYYKNELDHYGPFFIFVTDKGNGQTKENRYYFIHGKNIRWVDETGKQQYVADALYAPRHEAYWLAKRHLADFENQEFLDDETVNIEIEKIEELCRKIDSDISAGIYKKGDSDREGMGEWQHFVETYLDQNNQLIFSQENQSYEDGGYQTTEYYMNGKILYSESNNNYKEISEEDRKEGWVSSQYSVTSYYKDGELIRSISTEDDVSKIVF